MPGRAGMVVADGAVASDAPCGPSTTIRSAASAGLAPTGKPRRRRAGDRTSDADVVAPADHGVIALNGRSGKPLWTGATELSFVEGITVAKVDRDACMREMDALYPNYGLARH